MKSSGDWQGFSSTELQYAINQGLNGETVTVYPGTYTGPFTLSNGVNIFCLPGVIFTSADVNGTIKDGGVQVKMILSGEPTILNTGGGTPYFFTNANTKIDASNDFTDLVISGSLSISGSFLLPDVAETTGKTSLLVLDGNQIKWQQSVSAIVTQSANKVFLTQNDYYLALTSSYELTGSIDSDINQPNPSHKEGRLFYDSASHTYAIYNDIQNMTLQIGEETVIRVIAGEPILDGQAVYISGSNNIYPIIYLALADGMSSYKSQVIGIATHNINSGSEGFITVRGNVNDINTSAFTNGDALYLSYIESGSLINTIPPQPYEVILCGHCIYSDAINGRILVDIDAVPININTSVGIVDVPSFTDNGSGVFTVGTGSVNLNTLPDGKGVIKNYQLAEAQFTLTSSFLDVHYICACYNSGSPIYTLKTVRDEIDEIQGTEVATVTYGTGNSVLSYTLWDSPGILLANKIYARINHATGIERSEGLILGASGSRYVTVTEGHIWQGVKHIILSEVNSAPTASGGLASRIIQLVNVSGTWSGSLVTQYNNTQYNNVSGLSNLSANNFTINWVYRGVGSLNSTIIILDTQQYSKIADAVLAQPPSTPAEFMEIALLLGRVIYIKDSSTATQVDTAFTQVFVPAGITDHNLLNGLQGGTSDQYYHLTSNEYIGTGNGIFVKQINPTVSSSLEIITIAPVTSSLIMTSANGSKWNIWIDNNGQFSSSLI
jgi:hypothetical protein